MESINKNLELTYFKLNNVEQLFSAEKDIFLKNE